MQHETEYSNIVEEIAADDKLREQIKACERNMKCDVIGCVKMCECC